MLDSNRFEAFVDGKEKDDQLLPEQVNAEPWSDDKAAHPTEAARTNKQTNRTGN